MESVAAVLVALVILAAIAGAGVYLYRYSLDKYSVPLSRLEPRSCAGYEYLAGPEGLAIVYDRRASAYAGGSLIEEAYYKELVYIYSVNCTSGVALIANKTWRPGVGETPWRQGIIMFSANPAALFYVVPESFIRGLRNASVAPGFIAWKSVSGTARGGPVNITFLGAPAMYSIVERDSYDPSTGILTERTLVLTKTSGPSTTPIGIPVPDKIVSQTVAEKAYVKGSGDLFYNLKRLVDSMVAISLATGAIIGAAIVGAVRVLTA